jgi:hypothetical protein
MIAKAEGKKSEVSFGNIEEVLKAICYLEFNLRLEAMISTGMADKMNTPADVVQYIESRVQEFFKEYIKEQAKLREEN